MDRVQLVGVALTVAGVAGYVIAVFESYPGQAFSVTGVMVGLTLFAVGGDR